MSLYVRAQMKVATLSSAKRTVHALKLPKRSINGFATPSRGTPILFAAPSKFDTRVLKTPDAMMNYLGRPAFCTSASNYRDDVGSFADDAEAAIARVNVLRSPSGSCHARMTS